MNASIMINKRLLYFNTATAKHILGTWDQKTQVIKELHINKNGHLFFAVYDEENNKEYIKYATPQAALSFIDECKSNKMPIRWFPNGKNLLQQVVNNTFKPDEDFTEDVD